jgi:uncharacterized protein (DUF736 family)
MTTIATLTEKSDGTLEGTLATLNVTAQIAVVPNARKSKDNEPDLVEIAPNVEAKHVTRLES